MYGSRAVDVALSHSLECMFVFEERDLVFASLVLAYARDFLAREPRRLLKEPALIPISWSR